ncbi:MAG: hypothetical protein Q4A60_06390 [Pasteurellaceae bacterium]|nr:hypothetical protein [Pasteurellaceae bacterium]
MIITMEDMRRVDYCASGVEAFFKREGLDFDDFLQNGIESIRLLATGSVLARRCVAEAKKARKTREEK